MRTPLKPVDLLSIAFIVLLAAVTLAASPRLPHAGRLVARFAALIVSLLLISRYASFPKAPTWVRTVHSFRPS